MGGRARRPGPAWRRRLPGCLLPGCLPPGCLPPGCLLAGCLLAGAALGVQAAPVPVPAPAQPALAGPASVAPPPGAARPFDFTAPAPAALAQAALRRGQWTRAHAHAVRALAQQVPGVDALGSAAVSAAVLGEQRLLEAALARLQRVEPAPGHPRPLALAVSDLAARRLDAAARQLDTLAARLPEDALVAYFRGRLAEAQGRAAEAERQYRLAVAAGADFGPGLAALARRRSAAGAHDEAVRLAEAAVAAGPEDLEHRQVLAAALQAAGRSQQAQAVYAELLQDTPGLGDVGQAAAWALLRAGRAAEVEALLAQAERRHGPQPLGQLLLAMAAADLAQPQGVQRHLQAYLAARPGDRSAAAAAALVHLAGGQPQAAIALLQPAQAGAAPDARVEVHLAVAEQLAGRPQRAEAAVQRAAAAGESAPVLAWLRAHLAAARGDAAAYRAGLGEADALLPGAGSLAAPELAAWPAAQRADWAAARNVALLMFLNGWSTPMQAWSERALQRLPADPLALHLKALALKATGRGEEARAVLQALYRAEPGLLAAGLALADTLLDLRRGDEARRLMAAVPAPAQGRLLYQVGLLQQRAGNDAQARAAWQAALRTGDDGPWRAQAQQRLEAVPPGRR